MKVVHICLTGPLTDGWNYQENLLTKFQKELGYDVSIIASEWIWTSDGVLKKINRADYINKDGVHVVRLPMKGKDDFNKKFKKYLRLYETLEKLSPDVLFIHGVASLENKTIARYLSHHSEVVAYADNHADFSNSATNWLSKNILHKIIWKHYAWMLVPYVRKFYGVLPIRVDFLKEIYEIPAPKCELLVMGADDELVKKAEKLEIRKSIREKYNISDRDFLIMTGGKIDAWKRQTILLMEAVKSIQDRQIKLIVFGSVTEELRTKVEELADGEQIQYIGWIQADESYLLFSSADLVCFPGRHSVFWEQVAGQGIPMVVKDWPGTHHIDLGGNVIFLKTDSSDEIYKVLTKVVSDKKLYTRMKKVAVEKGMKKFSYKEISRRCIES